MSTKHLNSASGQKIDCQRHRLTSSCFTLCGNLEYHLYITQHGCFAGKNQDKKECGKDGDKLTPLPQSFKALPITKEMDDRWLDLIKDLEIA